MGSEKEVERFRKSALAMSVSKAYDENVCADYINFVQLAITAQFFLNFFSCLGEARKKKDKRKEVMYRLRNMNDLEVFAVEALAWFINGKTDRRKSIISAANDD